VVRTLSPRLQERFEILASVGEGGVAHVYRARERATGRLVALKVLKESLRADRDVVERFQREAFAVASIDSEHVVKMFDFGTIDGDAFIAMEYAAGMPLRAALDGKRWPAEQIRVVIGQAAEALAAAHEREIIHRDLKPENIMLVSTPRRAWQVKVLDFGFAKLAALEAELGLEPISKAGTCFGTPQYMPPEQMMGHSVDRGADLYALGVITYEMLAGKLPWDGADPREVFRSVLGSPPPRIERLHHSISRADAIHGFLQRALAKSARERPDDAATFFRELESALSPEVAAGARQGRAVFSSIIGETITREGGAGDGRDFVGEATEVDPGVEEALAETWERPARARRLRSGLHASVGKPKAPAAGEGFGDDGLYAAGRTPSRTELVAFPSRSKLAARLVPLIVVAISLLAAVTGYFVGASQH
jgi:hypothetical protein